MRRLRIRTPLVIHDTVEGEVLIVNLETGNYYSLVGTGARIWEALERTPTAEEVVAELRAAFESHGQVLEESVANFLAELEREGLIVPGLADEAKNGREHAPVDGPPMSAAARQAFQEPSFEKFTDMQELILLDPVHEVEEEKGWPHTTPTR